MKFASDKTIGHLRSTEVENVFITEYSASAPGEFVKVYLLILMCAESGQDMSLDELSGMLGVSEEEISEAITYWQERGVLRRLADGTVQTVSLRGKLFGLAEESKNPENTRVTDSALSDMYKSIEKITGRPLGGREPVQILSWIDDFGAAPEVIVSAYAYCKKLYGKDNASYVGAVAKDWAERGLDTVTKVDEYIEEVEKNKVLHKKVFKALGFSRTPTEEERRIMDTWFCDMKFPIERVLEACGKTASISNPNIGYVNAVLTNWFREESGVTDNGEVSQALIKKYYDFLREKAESEAKERLGEIYAKLPRIAEIDEEIKATGMEMSRIIISSGTSRENAAKEIRSRIDSLSAERAALLTENGYSADYTEVQYRCQICGDTGVLDDGTFCDCRKARTEEALIWQNSLKK